MQISTQYRRLHLWGGHLLIIQFSRGNSNQESFLEDKWFCYGARGGDLVDFWTLWSEHAFSMHSTLSSYFLRPSIQQWFVFSKTSAYSRRTLGIAFSQIFTFTLCMTSWKTWLVWPSISCSSTMGNISEFQKCHLAIIEKLLRITCLRIVIFEITYCTNDGFIDLFLFLLFHSLFLYNGRRLLIFQIFVFSLWINLQISWIFFPWLTLLYNMIIRTNCKIFTVIYRLMNLFIYLFLCYVVYGWVGLGSRIKANCPHVGSGPTEEVELRWCLSKRP